MMADTYYAIRLTLPPNCVAVRCIRLFELPQQLPAEGGSSAGKKAEQTSGPARTAATEELFEARRSVGTAMHCIIYLLSCPGRALLI